MKKQQENLIEIRTEANKALRILKYFCFKDQRKTTLTNKAFN